MFYEWLMNQVDRDDWIGDLANDAQRDPKAPAKGSVNTWRRYLNRQPGTCWQAREALEEAIDEYGVCR